MILLLVNMEKSDIIPVERVENVEYLAFLLVSKQVVSCPHILVFF